MTERFLHRDARALQQARFAQVLHDRCEQRRRHLQVVEGLVLAADLLGQRVVQGAIGDVAVEIGQPVCQLVEHFLVDLLAGIRNRRMGTLDQLVFADLVAGHSQDRTPQQSLALEAIEGLEGHLAGQVAGNPENHQQIRGAVAGYGQSGPPGVD
jgi:hypothetical protein